MEIILGTLGDTVRTQDIEHQTGLLDRDVVWKGVHPGQRCDGPGRGDGRPRRLFAGRELEFDAVAVIARGDAVVVGIHGPGLNGIPGDFETVGQVFHVFTLRDADEQAAFRDKAGRAHMIKSDGQEDSFDKMEDLLRSLLDPKEPVAG